VSKSKSCQNWDWSFEITWACQWATYLVLQAEITGDGRCLSATFGLFYVSKRYNFLENNTYPEISLTRLRKSTKAREKFYCISL
jgi:hypothetical protein